MKIFEELIKNHRKIPKEIKSKDKKYTLPVYHLTNYNNDVSEIKEFKTTGI